MKKLEDKLIEELMGPLTLKDKRELMLKNKSHEYNMGYMDASIKVTQIINDYLLEKMKQS